MKTIILSVCVSVTLIVVSPCYTKAVDLGLIRLESVPDQEYLDFARNEMFDSTVFVAYRRSGEAGSRVGSGVVVGPCSFPSTQCNADNQNTVAGLLMSLHQVNDILLDVAVFGPSELDGRTATLDPEMEFGIFSGHDINSDEDRTRLPNLGSEAFFKPWERIPSGGSAIGYYDWVYMPFAESFDGAEFGAKPAILADNEANAGDRVFLAGFGATAAIEVGGHLSQELTRDIRKRAGTQIVTYPGRDAVDEVGEQDLIDSQVRHYSFAFVENDVLGSTTFTELEAAGAPGDSGGAVLNEAGELLGIISNGLQGIGDVDSITGYQRAHANKDLTMHAMGLTEIVCNPDSMGDLNNDGIVAFDDFLVLSANFGLTVSNHQRGDIDCTGTVGFEDFLLLSVSFGHTVNAQPVPEPSGYVISVVCLAAAITILRPKRVQLVRA